jgi:signal transduction histidine kinase
MIAPFQTLRFRLTCQYVIIFGLLQVLLWTAVYVIVDDFLRMRFDAELLRRAQAIASALDAAANSEVNVPAAERARRIVESFGAEQFFIVVGLHEGGEAVRTANALGLSFGFVPSQTPGFRQPSLRTLKGSETAGWAEGEPVRVVTIERDSENPGSRYVQVAASLDPVQRIVRGIQRIIVVFVILSLMLAGVSSWGVAGRSLNPITVITSEARNLTAATLHQRITPPTQRDEVTEMVESINSMLSRLEVQFRNEHDFITHAAHELKTPLAVMLGHIQRLLHGPDLNPEIRDFLGSQEEELWRLLRTVESCLILSQARNAQRLPLTTPVMIEDAVLASVKSSRKDAIKRKVNVVPSIASIGEQLVSPIVLGDKDLLITMFDNLIGNAVRYTPEGGIVEVQVRCSLKDIRIAVRDRGPGIPEAHMDRVFEFCYQVNPGSTSAGKAGIGLAIVKAVAELHGGSVSMSNRDGGGCEFVVRLPLAPQ